jgi:uncharacterized RDD family membrane protein YckC
MNNFQICKTCQHRKYDHSENIYCGFNIEPLSAVKCEEYSHDEMEKIRLDLQKAKISNPVSGGTRFLNYILDFVAYMLVSFLIGIFIALVSELSGTDISWFENMGTIGEYIFGFIIMSGYYIFFESIFGQSLGKMITGTIVVTEEGEKPNLEKIMTRTLCRFIPFEAFSFLGSDAVGWHDSLSKTRVVKK